MADKNIYKPRYKIAFQAKSKIWAYKNSRLRRFFNIRGRKLIRRGLFKRYVLVFNNMKWTIARRYIRPYMYKRTPVRKKYKDIFYTKQQLRSFYGKLKENNFRGVFNAYLGNAKNRNKSFYAALESRVDMVLFRMRVLPTIFACNQLIHHHGILVNGAIVKSPNARLLPGDILSLQKNQWNAIKPYFFERAWYKTYGLYITSKRQYTLMKKKGWWAVKRNLTKISGRDLVMTAINLLKIYRESDLFFKNGVKKIVLFAEKAKNQGSIEQFQNVNILNKVLLLHKSFRFFYRKVISHVKQLINLRTKSKWWIRSKQLTFLLKKMSIIHSHRKNLAYLTLKLKLEELNLYENVILTIKDTERRESLLTFVEDKRKFLTEKYFIFKEKIQKQMYLTLRRKLRKYMLKPFKKFTPQGEKKIAFSNSLVFLLKNRRYKKQRAMQIPRLKHVHWYIPSYLHVDFRTFRSVLLYYPLPDEIVYSFKVSLPKIYSFYKSRGF